MLDPREPMTLILDANTPPDMRLIGGATEFCLKQFSETVGSFRENLIRMPVRQLHNSNNGEDVIVRDIRVKEITHRVDENHLWLRPEEWFHEFMRNSPEIKPLLVRMSRNPPESLGEGFRIAANAAGANLGATTDRIPCRIGPFDR